jgi:iron complex outermembrane receptor protein
MRVGCVLFVVLAGLPISAAAQEPPPKPPEPKPAAPIEIEETVTVTATRTESRLDDSPTRVEVLVREEIEEKMLMTPGDIVMMLNEMGGMRVQTTSPSLGAASVRIQGMKGRYTRVLADGLPLFGQQVGGLGLLQIPPMDLGQVEVIKGVASALYGSGAMGGVVNLISRRPGAEPVRDFLINQSTAGATDGVAFLSGRLSERWSASLLGGGHRQSRNDIDDDGWADLAGYGRGVLRPRVFWDNGQGANLFITAGATVESRDGGTLPGAVVPDGQPYVEALDTERFDAGASGQFLAAGRYVVTIRAAGSSQHHDHVFGPVLERDRHGNLFGEVAVRGQAGSHTWVGGAAFEHDRYDPQDVPRFAYRFNAPGFFAQDDIAVAPWLSLSASARLDVHSEYGTFFSPRASALFRGGGWISRLSVGQGFVAATPLTEETEAAGLSRLTLGGPLEAERGTSASWDITRTAGAASYTATVFASSVKDAVRVEREDRYELFNASGSVDTVGLELLATYRRAPFALTGTYTFVDSRETDDGVRVDAPLTPRHSAGIVGMWEEEDTGRVGVECYVTGPQRLEANPYRARSETYVVLGFLAERKVGPVRFFLNAENVTGVRQTTWDSLVRPSQGVDGRWTVDAWAPLDGRVFNGGVRWRW